MKRVFSLLVCLVALSNITAIGHEVSITAEEIVQRYAEALGGTDLAATVATLDLTLRYSDHAGLTFYDIERPNKSRFSDWLVFDGVRAAFLERVEDGQVLPPELVAEEEWSTTRSRSPGSSPLSSTIPRSSLAWTKSTAPTSI